MQIVFNLKGSFNEKLIKEKTDYLADMLAGMKIANDDIDIIADTVVVRK